MIDRRQLYLRIFYIVCIFGIIAFININYFSIKRTRYVSVSESEPPLSHRRYYERRNNDSDIDASVLTREIQFDKSNGCKNSEFRHTILSDKEKTQLKRSIVSLSGELESYLSRYPQLMLLHRVSDQNVADSFIYVLIDSQPTLSGLVNLVKNMRPHIKFYGQEEAIDANGVSRTFWSIFFSQTIGRESSQAKEVLQLDDEKVVSDSNKLFQEAKYQIVENGTNYICYYPLPDSTDENSSDKYFVFGTLLAYALIKRFPIGYNLCPGVLKPLVGLSINWGDLLYQRNDYYKYLNDDQTPEELQNILNSFATDSEDGGITEIFKNESSTLDEKKLALAKLLLIENQKRNLQYLRAGFNALIPASFFTQNNLNEKHLNVLLAGEATIDFDAFKRSFIYGICTAEDDGALVINNQESYQVVDWFWKVVEDSSFGQENLQLLWTFITGFEDVPFEGYGELRMRLVANSQNRTFIGHTCMKQIDVPLQGFSSIDQVKEALLSSIKSQGYGLK